MIMKTTLIAALAATALLAGCSKGDSATTNAATGGAGKTVSAPAGTDWTTTVVQTAEGGMLMGNPAAAVKLMEYGALSCPHCAKFSNDSAEGLKVLVAKGTVSYEFRPFLIHPQDVPAFVLARCNGAAPYFAIAEQMFATQDVWLSKSGTISQAEQQALASAGPLQVSAFLAGKLGLDTFVEQRGVPSAKVKQCLADQKAIDTLGKITEDGQKQFEITGTPTFIINGQTVKDANTWDKIEPMLKAAGA
jgi:protein-disulfide isomerase